MTIDIRTFRGKSLTSGKWVYGYYCLYPPSSGSGNLSWIRELEHGWVAVDEKTVGQYTGIKDINESEYYHCDIGEFDNGDRFVIKREWFLQFYGEWIGEPECEDQLRYFYRIEKAKIIGNLHENPELLEVKK